MFSRIQQQTITDCAAYLPHSPLKLVPDVLPKRQPGHGEGVLGLGHSGLYGWRHLARVQLRSSLIPFFSPQFKRQQRQRALGRSVRADPAPSPARHPLHGPLNIEHSADAIMRVRSGWVGRVLVSAWSRSVPVESLRRSGSGSDSTRPHAAAAHARPCPARRVSRVAWRAPHNGIPPVPPSAASAAASRRTRSPTPLIDSSSRQPQREGTRGNPGLRLAGHARGARGLLVRRVASTRRGWAGR